MVRRGYFLLGSKVPEVVEIVGILVRDRDRVGEVHFRVQLLWRHAMWILIRCSLSLLVRIVVVKYVLLQVSIGSIHCLLPPPYILCIGVNPPRCPPLGVREVMRDGLSLEQLAWSCS